LEDRNKMHDASRQNKKVEKGMHIPVFFAEAVENGTKGVRNSSCNQPEQSLQGNGFHNWLNGKNGTPAHTQITGHGKHCIFL